MAWLVPAIHALLAKTWMPGTKAGHDGMLLGACRHSFRRTDALQAELALPPNHEQPGRGYDRGTGKDKYARKLIEEKIAEQEHPYHRRVVERSHQRGWSKTVALGEKEVSEAAA